MSEVPDDPEARRNFIPDDPTDDPNFDPTKWTGTILSGLIRVESNLPPRCMCPLGPTRWGRGAETADTCFDCGGALYTGEPAESVLARHFPTALIGARCVCSCDETDPQIFDTYEAWGSHVVAALREAGVIR